MNNQEKLRVDYLTSEQVAQGFGISRRTLNRWGRLKKGPPQIKVGRSVFFRRAALERWLMSLERGADANATVARSSR